ncbi:MAG: autotransporter-associated beta strand repeat-containing protein [Planctomycetaceae bacterium]
MRLVLAFAAWFGLAAAASVATAQVIPAFPGAEGAGAAATGGRGGDVYFVTSLADTTTLGTLRYGLATAPSSGRTILFRTGGTIYLQSTLDVNKPKITIAGQSAPGDGITLAYRQTQVSGVSDVVIRNIRLRPGNSVTLAMAGTATPYEPDALHVEGVNRVMVDHVSASWSVDEVLSVTNSTNVSVQWSAITEALRNAGHSKGAHGYGALISGDMISYHHNYLSHNDSRNPRPGLSVSGSYVTGTINFDYRNNVNYDWGNENGYNGDEAGVMNMNYVGNYSVAGPSTTSSKRGRAFLVGLTDTRLFLSGNKIDSDRDLLRDGVDSGWSMIATSTSTNPSKPTAAVGNTTFVSTQTADAAYASVLAYAGARYWNRDSVDARVFSEPATQGGRIIDSGTQVGGYPTLATGTAATDTDNDGMPDAWESSLGLNPAVANNNADFDADGYTDLEEYLNDLAAWPAPLPAVLATGSSVRYAMWSNWDTAWQPSRLDTAVVASGTAVVDAVGQDAGTLLVGGTTAGTTATLSLTSGGLRVATNLQIGSSTASTGRATVGGGGLTVGGTIMSGSATSGVFAVTGGTVSTGEILVASSGTWTIGGGMVRAASIRGASSGTATRTLSWSSGTIQNRDAATDLTIAGSNGLVLALSGSGAKTLAADDGRTVTVAARISGTGAAVTKTGGGTLVLSGSNSGFTGGFVLAGGTVVLGNTLAFGASGTVTTMPLSSSTVSLLGATTLAGVPTPLVLGTNTSLAVFGGTNGMVFSGGMQLAGGGRAIQNSVVGRTLEFSGTTVLGLRGTSVPRTLTISGSGTTLFSGAIVNGGTAGNAGLVVTTTGTTILAAANTFTGTTTILRGELRLAHGVAAGSTTVAPLAGGTVTLAPGLRATVGGLRPTGGGLVDVGTGMITVTGGLAANDLLTALQRGLGDGAWNGTSGIVSSTAAASGGSRTVGWLDNGDGTVTCGFAAPGDSNLDWQVDILDVANFVSGASAGGGGAASWVEGDYNYDGVVDVIDAAAFVATGLLDDGPYQWSTASGPVAAVPEPATGWLVWLAAAMAGLSVLNRAAIRGLSDPRKPEVDAGIDQR